MNSIAIRIMTAVAIAYCVAHLGVHFAVKSGVLVPAVYAGLTFATWTQVIEVAAMIFAAAWAAQRWGGPRAKSVVAVTQLGKSGTKPAKELQLQGRAAHEIIHDLAILYEIGQDISATINLDELLDRITSMMQLHFDLREFAILLIDDAKDFLQVKVAFGFEDDSRVRDMIFHVGEGVSGQVARSNKPVYIRDTRRDRRYLHYRGEMKEDGCLLSLPLRYKRDVLGVVNFGRRGVSRFSKNDLRFLTLVANQIALAIANAKLYSKTRELAVRDDLTGLYNRRHFQEVMHIEWKRARRFRRAIAVLMIDVDHFKAYNDTYGHLHGDKVLCQIASILRRNLREVDTIARFGGEEFVALLPDTDAAGAKHVGEKLRQLVESESFPVPEGEEARSLTISIGIGVYPDDSRQIDDLIDHADIALYDAKDSGRNCIVCYPTVVTPLEAPEEDETTEPIATKDKLGWR